jgi:hypothetical protein
MKSNLFRTGARDRSNWRCKHVLMQFRRVLFDIHALQRTTLWQQECSFGLSAAWEYSRI